MTCWALLAHCYTESTKNQCDTVRSDWLRFDERSRDVVAVLTHGVPHVDVAAAPPVVALGEGPPVGEHVAPLRVETLPEAVVVHPGRPVVDVARVELSVSWTQTERTEVCVCVTVFLKIKVVFPRSGHSTVGIRRCCQ